MSQLMPGRSLAFLLTDVSRLFHQSFEKAVEAGGVGLTPGEIRVLCYIATHNGSRQTVLADLIGVEPMTLSAYIDRLEMQGLVTRMPDPTDRRAKVIRTTERVEKLFEEVHPIAHGVYDLATRGLSADQLRTVELGLVAMRANFSGDLVGDVEKRARVQNAKTVAA